MKIILLSLTFTLLFCLQGAYAQNKTINTFYKTHRKGDNGFGLRIPGWIVQAGINIAVGKEGRRELKPIRPFLRRLKGVRMLTVENATQMPQEAVSNFVRDLKQHNFSTLARIKDEGARVEVLMRIRERGPKKNAAVSSKTYC